MQKLKYVNLHGLRQCQPPLPNGCLSHRPFKIHSIDVCLSHRHKQIQTMPKLILRQYLINEELLLQEIEIGRVFLQVFHNFFHLGSPHLPDQILKTPIFGPKLHHRPCSYCRSNFSNDRSNFEDTNFWSKVAPTLFMLHRVRAGKGISQIGTGVLVQPK